MECEYCNITVKSKYILKNHLVNNKACLRLRGLTMKSKFTCKGCNTTFMNNTNLNIHLESCKKYILLKVQEEHVEQIETLKKEHNKEIETYQQQIIENQNIIKKLEGELLIQKIENERIYDKLIINTELSIRNFNFLLNKFYQKNYIFENIHKKDINKIEEYTFGNNNFIVPIRADGMINATALCKAGEKRLDHYKESQHTKAFIEELSLITGIRVSNLFEANIGGHDGTWVHRKVAYHLAQWISPKFAVQVTNILDELFISGNVDIYNQKLLIETKYKHKINNLNKEYKTLLIKHNSSLKTHRYIKFKQTDPCFYIIDSGLSCDCGQPTVQYKFGITGNDQNTIDDRLRSHRTLWPLLKVRFLLFMKDVIMIEKNFKMMYEKEINPNGHEIIEGVTLEDIIENIKKLFDILFIKDYYIIEEEKLKEYNDYVDTTIKTKY